MPTSGVLWRATQATADKGAVAWPDIVHRLTDAIESELGSKRRMADGYCPS